MSFTQMMIYVIGIFCWSYIIMQGYRKAQIRRTLDKRRPEVLEAPAEERIDFSRIAQDICYKFYALPESHRPAHDIRVPLKALDVKYVKDRVDNHFRGGNLRTHDQPWNCDCKNGFQTSNRGNKFCNMPEYMTLWFEIADIEKAIAAQKRAEVARERAIELAGIENDLASVEEITNAMRIERDAIHEITKELRVL